MCVCGRGGSNSKVLTGYKVVTRTNQRKYYTVSGHIRLLKDVETHRRVVNNKQWGPFTLFESKEFADRYKKGLESLWIKNLTVVEVEYEESTAKNQWTHEESSGVKHHPKGTVFARWIKLKGKV